jgi:hypothetical protein
MSLGASVLVFVVLCVICYGGYGLYDDMFGENGAVAILLWILCFGVGGYLIVHSN